MIFNCYGGYFDDDANQLHNIAARKLQKQQLPLTPHGIRLFFYLKSCFSCSEAIFFCAEMTAKCVFFQSSFKLQFLPVFCVGDDAFLLE